MKEVIKVIEDKENVTVVLQGKEKEIVIGVEKILESLLKIDENERVTALIYLYSSLSNIEKEIFLIFLHENPKYL